ncbi:MAG: hypothetical protein JRJ45_08890 [Deltaproteobacteria bacterium]|nr:hypothetical protein [Deltaproteobacteria bacterium]
MNAVTPHGAGQDIFIIRYGIEEDLALSFNNRKSYLRLIVVYHARNPATLVFYSTR